MELLMRLPRARATLRPAVVASVVVHTGLLAVVALAPHRPASREEPPISVTVDLVAEPVAPAEEVPAPPPPITPAAPPRLRASRAPAPAAPAPPAAAMAATPPDDPTPVPDAPTVPAALPGAPTGLAPAGLVGAQGGTAAGQVGGTGTAGTAPVAPRAPTEAERRSLIDGYLRARLRPRIDERFRYPAEAREQELSGQVLVRLTVSKTGHLVAARLAAACPHGLLCEDALRTVNAAAPFPPIPADLGESIQVDVPLRYDFGE